MCEVAFNALWALQMIEVSNMADIKKRLWYSTDIMDWIVAQRPWRTVS